MNKQIKQRWIDALRSGEYSQGQGCLHDSSHDLINGSFCCLGVLCDLYIKDNPDVAWDYTRIDEDKQQSGDEDKLKLGKTINGYEGYLPGEVIEWAGLNSVGGDVVVIQDNGTPAELTELNDIGASFHKIARYIESSIDPDEDEESDDNSSCDDEISSEERNACDHYNERYSYPSGD